jgi:hypothetical protein
MMKEQDQLLKELEPQVSRERGREGEREREREREKLPFFLLSLDI